MAFKVDKIKELGTIKRRADQIVVEIVRYGDKSPVVNVQILYEDKETGELKHGKRPSYDLETLTALLPLLKKGKEELSKLVDTQK